MFGKPVIAGTRITVEQILRSLSADSSVERIIERHPQLAEDDVRAALSYAADHVADDWPVLSE
jgi:uncharacterized protein (DUF433 family)